MLRLSAVTAGSAGAYAVVVSNAAGAVASDAAVLTVSPGGPPGGPDHRHPAGRDGRRRGDTATFAVGVSGGGPLTFQWRKDGAPSPAPPAPPSPCPAWPPGDAGNYAVVVSNAAGSATSLAPRSR